MGAGGSSLAAAPEGAIHCTGTYPAGTGAWRVWREKARGCMDGIRTQMGPSLDTLLCTMSISLRTLVGTGRSMDGAVDTALTPNEYRPLGSGRSDPSAVLCGGGILGLQLGFLSAKNGIVAH